MSVIAHAFLVALVVSLSASEDPFVLGFLRQFGFLEAESDLLSPCSVVDVAAAVRAAQMEMGLPATGLVDNDTLALMRSQRCGVSPGFPSGPGRVRRYALMGSRWRLTPVTLLIDEYHPDLPRSKVDIAVDAVLAAVSAMSQVKFSRLTSPALTPDIRVSFVDSDHGCVRTLQDPAMAHAFPPRFGGDVHLWKQVNWTRTRLDRVFAHELLHALGLDHSSDSTALMYAYYRDPPPGSPFLADDDVRALQRLYGVPSYFRIAGECVPRCAFVLCCVARRHLISLGWQVWPVTALCSGARRDWNSRGTQSRFG